MTRLDDLPPELLTSVLSYLPVKSLLAFGATNSSNHVFALACFDTLNIGIYPTRNAAILSEQQYSDLPGIAQDQAIRRTNLILPQKQCQTMFRTVHYQNEAATDMLKTYGPSLRTLDLSIWDLLEHTAVAISKSPRLRHLTLKMDHPHSRAKNMPGLFWFTSPGSTVWNRFYVAPPRVIPMTPPESPRPSRYPSPEPIPVKPIFGQLETLHLERAGITDYQIQRLIKENPNLREIRLKKCFTLTDEFFRDLSRSGLCLSTAHSKRKGLGLLHFEMSSNPLIDERILQYIGMMKELKSLSFAGCSNLHNRKIRESNEAEWKIDELTLPQSEDTPEALVVEVDPSYMS